MGSNLLFNYNEPIWTLKTSECNAYFSAVQTGVVTTASYDRCSDSGFLEWLRVVGTVALSFELIVIVIAVMNYVNSLPAVVNSNRMDAAGGGYNAEPVVAETH